MVYAYIIGVSVIPISQVRNDVIAEFKYLRKITRIVYPAMTQY
jgi:hypothetical protein